MEIASFIISIVGVLIGIIGIIGSLHCWKHTWKSIQLSKRMQENNFSNEGDFTRFTRDAIDHIEEGQNSPFQFNNNFENNVKSVIYNMCDNLYEEREE